MKSRLGFSLLVLIWGLLFQTASFALETKYDVVILGAGPSGLAAALTAAQAGAKVLVVEARSYTEQSLIAVEGQRNPWGSRQRVVAIDASAMKLAMDLCQCEIPFSKIQSYRAHTGGGPVVLSSNPVTRKAIDLVFRRGFGGTIRIGELERSLYDAARSHPQIDISFDSKAEQIEKGWVSIAGPNQTTKVATSLTVIAEGANSSSLQKLGVGRSGLGYERSTWAVGNFQSEKLEDGEYVIEFRRNLDHPYYALALVSHGVTTVYASPYSGDFEGRNVHQILRKTALLMGIKGNYQEDASVFSTFVDRSNVFSIADKNIAIIGDAAHKGDPYSGFGVTAGLNESRAVGQLVGSILLKAKSSGEPYQRFDNSLDGSISKVSEFAKIFKGLRFWIRSKLGQIPISVVVKAVGVLGEFFSESKPGVEGSFPIQTPVPLCRAVHL